MKRCLVGLGYLLLLAPCSTAQEKPEYRTALIPDSLKKNAHVVVRSETTNIIMGNGGKMEVKSKKVLTVLTETGIRQAGIGDYEDRFHKLQYAEARLYDSTGRQIKKYKKKDLEKTNYDDGFSVMNDIRIYYLELLGYAAPLTIEFETEVTRSGYMELPDFITAAYGKAIQSSSLTIQTTANNKIRYKNSRTALQPVITQAGDQITYNWQVANARALKAEAGSPEGSAPMVVITPTNFEMDNYPGSFSSWQSYGDWQNKLNEGTQTLPQDRFAYFSNMVKNIPDTVEKIRTLYRYLQENYRYVSIQLGIGGFKPFDAAYVDKNKFGDCKALSNFMLTMLKTAGIRSHYALVNAGYDEAPADPDFASDPFNHVILCVPGKDTIWLECTSRDGEFGKLGSFTENRYALLVTETGGQLVATPGSRAANNVFGGNNTVIMEADGSAKAVVNIRHKGSVHEMFRDALWQQPEHRQKEFLMHIRGFKDYNMNRLVKETIGKEEGITRLEMQFEKIPDFSAGSKHFLRPHVYTVWSTPLPEQKTERTTDFMLRDAFLEADTTVWQLPDGYIAENVPPSVSFSIGMASFEMKYINDAAARKITAITRLEIKSNRIPAAQYNDAKKFFQRVLKELEEKIIVKRG